ncbi:MAG TPA: fimbria/pilus outer membrane usher protein [Steroidobacteraceae bacterium]|nr:fimbria/pilus outer membrane usher protein [Steroidobacteraceae bacterium]
MGMHTGRSAYRGCHRRSRIRVSLAWWALLLLSAGAHAGTSPQAAPAGVAELWLAVVLNGQPVSQAALVLRLGNGQLLVSRSDLRSWRLRTPRAAGLRHQDEDYLPLDALRMLRYRVDDTSQTLIVNAPPGAFLSVSIRGSETAFARPDPSPPGAFLNYDLTATRSNVATAESALLEPSLFGHWGNWLSDFLARNAGGHERLLRLDTTWTRDQPESATTLRIGDAITGASGLWGGAVRFAGVQWGTDFATQPGLITFPLPTIGAATSLPATVDLYVNGALRMSTNVPMGPFQLQNVPAITGDGQIQVVVRDLMGREQVITQPFYASPELLREGLQDFSYEAGVARENYGLASDDYGHALLVGSDRIGLSDSLTADLHGELLRDRQTIGIGGDWLLPSVGIASAAVAGSHSGQGAGGLAVLGFDRTARRFSFGVNIQIADKRFTDVGSLDGQPMPIRMTRAYASVALGRLGSLSVVSTRQDYGDGHVIDLSSIREDFQMRRLGFLSLSVTRARAATADTTVELTFTRALGERTSATLDATSQDGRGQGLMQVQRNLPAGPGSGYRVSAGMDGSPDGEAEYIWQTAAGTYDVDAQRMLGETQESASAAGGVAFFGNQLFAARSINGSFAVVNVADEPGVRVYDDNQLVGRTNSRGQVLVPNLLPYEDNQISIEQADLPLDAEISTVEKNAVPYFRSGTLVRFPVVHPHGALITLVLASGKDLPAGALVQVAGRDEEYPSALHGEVYVVDFATPAVLRASWPGGTCAATVPAAVHIPSDDPLPQLGPFVCKDTHAEARK